MTTNGQDLVGSLQQEEEAQQRHENHAQQRLGRTKLGSVVQTSTLIMSHPEPTQDASEPSSTMQSSDAVHQMNQMGYRCVQFLPNDRNIVVSPYTIANMLVLLHKGSAGDTRAMLEKATNCGNLDRDLSPIFRRLSAELFNDPEGTHDFDLATVVMVGCECVTTPEVSSYLVENLNGRTECVPKENFREKASERLRLWARHATRGEVTASSMWNVVPMNLSW
ncbi:uncharacterized protein LOC135376225 [Ornithodoros turicata]|uniref:uncharacterized protein LOC135376225 n=1 Tax=Ornithodoros turicata TaxID=34597 RepID=UPI003138854D